jgi:hypothetical protein
MSRPMPSRQAGCENATCSEFAARSATGDSRCHDPFACKSRRPLQLVQTLTLAR